MDCLSDETILMLEAPVTWTVCGEISPIANYEVKVATSRPISRDDGSQLML